MITAKKLFSGDDRLAIEAAIERAELKTSGEIIPVVATASGRYDRGEDIFGLLFALVLLAIFWLTFQGVEPRGGDWESGTRITLGLLPILLIIAAGFAAGASLATWIPVLRLPFTPRTEIDEEVARAAAEAFHNHRLRATGGATGVLIYVSLFEHRVVVVGDDAISAKISQGDWDAIRDLVIDGHSRQAVPEGLINAIDKCGELLGEHFPRAEDDQDELPNRLILVD